MPPMEDFAGDLLELILHGRHTGDAGCLSCGLESSDAGSRIEVWDAALRVLRLGSRMMD